MLPLVSAIKRGLLTDQTTPGPGVHCTHGYNRTGFMIVAYMVEELDCDVNMAIKTFAEARSSNEPCGIYKSVLASAASSHPSLWLSKLTPCMLPPPLLLLFQEGLYYRAVCSL